MPVTFISHHSAAGSQQRRRAVDRSRAVTLSGLVRHHCAICADRPPHRAGGPAREWDQRLIPNDEPRSPDAGAGREESLIRARGGASCYRDYDGTGLTVSSDVTSERRFQSRVRVLRVDKLVRQDPLVGCAGAQAIPVGVPEHLLVSNLLAGLKAVSRFHPGVRLTGVLGMERTERVWNASAQRARPGKNGCRRCACGSHGVPDRPLLPAREGTGVRRLGINLSA